MKFTLGLLLLFVVSNSVAFSETVSSCNDVKIITGISEITGEFILADYALSVDVQTKRGTKYGYQAVMIFEGENYVEKDVNFTVFNREMSQKEYKEYEGTGFFNMDPKKIDSASYSDIGVEENSDDAAGLGLLTFYDENQKVLGKLIRIGWGFGFCKKAY